MEYFLNPFASVVHSKLDSSRTVFVGNGITVECFHLKEATSILENNDSPCYSEGENALSVTWWSRAVWNSGWGRKSSSGRARL